MNLYLATATHKLKVLTHTSLTSTTPDILCFLEHILFRPWYMLRLEGGGPRVVVSTAAFHARVCFPVSAFWKKTKMLLSYPLVKLSIVGSLSDRELACSASDLQGLNLESCAWRTVSSQSSHHPHEVLLAQFSLYVHKSGLKPIHFISFCWDLNFTTHTFSVIYHLK